MNTDNFVTIQIRVESADFQFHTTLIDLRVVLRYICQSKNKYCRSDESSKMYENNFSCVIREITFPLTCFQRKIPWKDLKTSERLTLNMLPIQNFNWNWEDWCSVINWSDAQELMEIVSKILSELSPILAPSDSISSHSDDLAFMLITRVKWIIDCIKKTKHCYQFSSSADIISADLLVFVHEYTIAVWTFNSLSQFSTFRNSLVIKLSWEPTLNFQFIWFPLIWRFPVFDRLYLQTTGKKKEQKSHMGKSRLENWFPHLPVAASFSFLLLFLSSSPKDFQLTGKCFQEKLEFSSVNPLVQRHIISKVKLCYLEESCEYIVCWITKSVNWLIWQTLQCWNKITSLGLKLMGLRCELLWFFFTPTSTNFRNFSPPLSLEGDEIGIFFSWNIINLIREKKQQLERSKCLKNRKT